MKNILFGGCFLVLFSISCKEDDDTDMQVIEEEIVESSYYLAIDGWDIQEGANDICIEVGSTTWSMWGSGGTDKFLFTGGYKYRDYDSGFYMNIYCHIQDSLNIGHRFFPTDMRMYLTDKQDKVLFEVEVEFQDETYKNVWYDIIPGNPFIFPNIYDINATQLYSPTDDIQIVDCVDELGEILPLEYSYQGWIYTKERADSLYVDSLYCSYYLLGG